MLLLLLLLLLALNIRAFSQQAANNKSHCRALHVLNDKHNYAYTLASEEETGEGETVYKSVYIICLSVCVCVCLCVDERIFTLIMAKAAAALKVLPGANNKYFPAQCVTECVCVCD